MSKQDTDINQLLSFLTSPVSNQNKVSFESFNDLFIPIKKSISEENRRLTKLQNNTVISNKSNRYRTLNSQPKQILTIKEEPKSTIIIHTEPGTNRIRFGRTEGKVIESPDQIALKREMLSQVLTKRGVISPPPFQIPKKPEAPKFVMERDIVDDLNKDNKYLSRMQIEYKQS